ncbi:MAG: Na(+)-translocating NADH-quinone reductase subunit A [Crocinitomicaceae bacterium]|nr:Na(+)-translocating NADH-quinone reductase subunit A [Crocinitomicaceae bacterium]
MSKAVKIRRGLNIALQGNADKVHANANEAKQYAIKPTDFHGLMPKLVGKEGHKLKAGSVLFYDKYNESIKYASPVSGEISEIRRGEKRKILEVIITPDGKDSFEKHDVADPNDLSREEILEKMLASGLWPFIKMRPVDIVANPTDNPKMIVVSAFDSHPLAPDYNFLLKDEQEAFQSGINALNKLTEGSVHLNIRGEKKQNSIFEQCKNVQINLFGGVHPCGNVGVQIHHIDPINKGEVVWTVNPSDVATIGKFFMSGRFDTDRVVALTGSKVNEPRYLKTKIGASIESLVKDNIEADNVRIISGNVLTGDMTNDKGFVGYYHHQITVVPEGDHHKFFLTDGWLSLGFNRFSMSMAYPTMLNAPSKKWDLDTNLNGEERAFVVSEQYEKVFPFDIYPVFLLKSILTNDIDGMEKLGIYEVAPEDFALCEFVCTSKINSQKIIRDGLDIIKEECL